MSEILIRQFLITIALTAIAINLKRFEFIAILIDVLIGRLFAVVDLFNVSPPVQELKKKLGFSS